MRKQKVDTKTESYDKLKDTTQKLKAENRQLRKQLKAAQKELARLQQHEVDRSLELEDDFEVSETKPKTAPISKTPKCPKCKEETINFIPAGIFTIHTCDSCGFKKRFKNALQK
jgi:predicted nuclease with TOPRIM domain